MKKYSKQDWLLGIAFATMVVIIIANIVLFATLIGRWV